LLIIFLLTWQTIVPAAVKDRVLNTYDTSTGQLEDSAAERVTLWEDAIEAFQQEPVFGKGFNTYQFLGRLGGWRDSHNYYVKLIFELGLVGLLLFLYQFWKLYRVGYRLFRSAKDPFFASLGLGVAGWMVCAVFANFFGDRWNWVQITGYLWTFAALVVRGQKITESEALNEATVSDESSVYA
jgi:O-antigen ligase